MAATRCRSIRILGRIRFGRTRVDRKTFRLQPFDKLCGLLNAARERIIFILLDLSLPLEGKGIVLLLLKACFLQAVVFQDATCSGSAGGEPHVFESSLRAVRL